MTVQVSQLLLSVWLPQDNVALHTARGDLLVLSRVDEAVDTLQVKVEGLLRPVVQSLKLVHVNETIKRRGDQQVQIFVVLDLGDPTPMTMNFDAGEALFFYLVLSWSLVLDILALSSLTIVIIIMLVLLLVFFALLLDLCLQVSDLSLCLSKTLMACRACCLHCSSSIKRVSPAFLLFFAGLFLHFSEVEQGFLETGLFESLVAPLGLVIILLELILMTDQVVTILLKVLLMLTDMPVGLEEVILRDDTQVITP